jgi:hypothetical protein
MKSPSQLDADDVSADVSSLPGCDWDSLIAKSPRHDQAKESQDWYVKTSAHQIINKYGQPMGFKHSLMYKKKLVSTGVGGDVGRTLQSQADFMNSKCSTDGAQHLSVEGRCNA